MSDTGKKFSAADIKARQAAAHAEEVATSQRAQQEARDRAEAVREAAFASTLELIKKNWIRSVEALEPQRRVSALVVATVTGEGLIQRFLDRLNHILHESGEGFRAMTGNRPRPQGQHTLKDPDPETIVEFTVERNRVTQAWWPKEVPRVSDVGGGQNFTVLIVW